jgi:hypothetical protein
MKLLSPEQVIFSYGKPTLGFAKVKGWDIKTKGFIIHYDCANDILHEIAHLLQLSVKEYKRVMKKGDMDFRVPKELDYDRYICEPKTRQITTRELETFAIQYHLTNT